MFNIPLELFAYCNNFIYDLSVKYYVKNEKTGIIWNIYTYWDTEIYTLQICQL